MADSETPHIATLDGEPSEYQSYTHYPHSDRAFDRPNFPAAEYNYEDRDNAPLVKLENTSDGEADQLRRSDSSRSPPSSAYPVDSPDPAHQRRMSGDNGPSSPAAPANNHPSLAPSSSNLSVNTSVRSAVSALSSAPGSGGAPGGPKRFRPAPAKTFQCRGYGDCRMVFSRSEHLARHIRKHTGERPFTCHCGKQFSRLDNLRQHAQTVHADKADENDRMMRDLTTLHATMASAHKVGGRRKGPKARGGASNLLGSDGGHPSRADAHQQNQPGGSASSNDMDQDMDSMELVKREDMVDMHPNAEMQLVNDVDMEFDPRLRHPRQQELLQQQQQQQRELASRNNPHAHQNSSGRADMTRMRPGTSTGYEGGYEEEYSREYEPAYDSKGYENPAWQAGPGHSFRGCECQSWFSRHHRFETEREAPPSHLPFEKVHVNEAQAFQPNIPFDPASPFLTRESPLYVNTASPTHNNYGSPHVSPAVHYGGSSTTFGGHPPFETLTGSPPYAGQSPTTGPSYAHGGSPFGPHRRLSHKRSTLDQQLQMSDPHDPQQAVVDLVPHSDSPQPTQHSASASPPAVGLRGTSNGPPLPEGPPRPQEDLQPLPEDHPPVQVERTVVDRPRVVVPGRGRRVVKAARSSQVGPGRRAAQRSLPSLPSSLPPSPLSPHVHSASSTYFPYLHSPLDDRDQTPHQRASSQEQGEALQRRDSLQLTSQVQASLHMGDPEWAQWTTTMNDQQVFTPGGSMMEGPTTRHSPSTHPTHPPSPHHPQTTHVNGRETNPTTSSLDQGPQSSGSGMSRESLDQGHHAGVTTTMVQNLDLNQGDSPSWSSAMNPIEITAQELAYYQYQQAQHHSAQMRGPPPHQGSSRVRQDSHSMTGAHQTHYSQELHRQQQQQLQRMNEEAHRQQQLNNGHARTNAMAAENLRRRQEQQQQQALQEQTEYMRLLRVEEAEHHLLQQQHQQFFGVSEPLQAHHHLDLSPIHPVDQHQDGSSLRHYHQTYPGVHDHLVMGASHSGLRLDRPSQIHHLHSLDMNPMLSSLHHRDTYTPNHTAGYTSPLPFGVGQSSSGSGGGGIHSPSDFSHQMYTEALASYRGSPQHEPKFEGLEHLSPPLLLE